MVLYVCVVPPATGQIRHLLSKSNPPLTSPRLVLMLQAKSMGVKDLFIGVSDCRTKTWHELRLTIDSSVFTSYLKHCNHSSVWTRKVSISLPCHSWCHVSTKLCRNAILVLFYFKLLVTYSYKCLTSDITMTLHVCCQDFCSMYVLSSAMYAVFIHTTVL